MTIEAKSGEGRSAGNEAMLDTAFLYGPNAVWIEQLHAQYVEDPSSVPESWQDFFRQIDDVAGDATKAARGPEWREPLRSSNGELVSALDGNWGTQSAKELKKAPAVGPALIDSALRWSSGGGQR